MVWEEIRGNNALSKFFTASFYSSSFFSFFFKSTDGHVNCGLIVSSISAHSCHGTKHGFPLKHKTFFFCTKPLTTCFQLLHTNTYWQGLNILTFVRAYRHWIVSCILKDNNTKFLPKPFIEGVELKHTNQVTEKPTDNNICPAQKKIQSPWRKNTLLDYLIDNLMDDKTFLIKANYMEKSYSVSYLLILSHLQKMLGEDGDYLLVQLISWGRVAIRGYRWQGTEWIAMSVRKHKTFWCLSDITMGASLPWRTGNIGWYLKDFVFCFSKKE